MRVEFRSAFAHPAADLWAFHARPGAFSRLAPPWRDLRLVSWTGGIRDGGRLDFDLLGPAGLALRWTAVHEAYREGEQFADRQERGPFAAWYHVHRVRPGRGEAGVPAGQVKTGGAGFPARRAETSEEANSGREPPPAGWEARPTTQAAGREARPTTQEAGWEARPTGDPAASPGQTTSELIDDIDFTPPLGPLGGVLNALVIRDDLRRLFAWRHRRTADDLARHARFADRSRQRILVTGSSGLIGTALCAFWSNAGHEVHRLVRRAPRAVVDGSGREFSWDPAAGTLDPAAFEGVDAVVHLAGANLLARRWDAAFKREMIDSRVRSTDLLARAIARLPRPPVFLVASGTSGVPRNTPAVDESIPLDTSRFLGELTRDWEAAADPARAFARVVHLRIGVVLAARGGALRTLLPGFSVGLGGRLGSGMQRMSWISLDDLLGVFDHALHTRELHGPVHAVAPGSVTNAEFTATLARVLHRPALVPAPAWAVRAVFGEVSSEGLGSYDLRPAALLESGFSWRTPALEEALRVELGRVRH